MKTLDEYMSAPYKMLITPDGAEGGFTVSFPDLPGCVTCGETLDEAIANAGDAKRAWLEAAIEDGLPVPEYADKDYSGQFKLRLPRSLHRSLAERSRSEGVSMNQYCVYLLSRALVPFNTPRT